MIIIKWSESGLENFPLSILICRRLLVYQARCKCVRKSSESTLTANETCEYWYIFWPYRETISKGAQRKKKQNLNWQIQMATYELHYFFLMQIKTSESWKHNLFQSGCFDTISPPAIHHYLIFQYYCSPNWSPFSVISQWVLTISDECLSVALTYRVYHALHLNPAGSHAVCKGSLPFISDTFPSHIPSHPIWYFSFLPCFFFFFCIHFCFGAGMFSEDL